MTQPDSEEEAKRHLKPGEALVWAGFPRQGLVLRPNDPLMMVAVLAFCAIGAFIEYALIAGGGSVVSTLWRDSSFLLLGLYVLVGRHLLDTIIRSRVAYALTDHRVLFFSGFLSRSVRAFDVRTLSRVSLEDGKAGVGSVILGSESRWFSLRGVTWPGAQLLQAPTFELIPNAYQVYWLIREMRKGLP